MNPDIRRYLLPSLILVVLIHLLLNRALPAVLLTTGREAILPAWAQLFLANTATLFIAVVLVDLGWHILRQHAFSGILLLLLGVLGVGLPLFRIPNAGQLVASIGVVATLSVCGGMALRRQMPLRANCAVVWLGCVAILSQLYSMGGWLLPPHWTPWLLACIEVCVVFTSVVVFVAWCTPLRGISVREAIAALLISVAFALFFALEGYAVTSAVLSSSGLTLFLPLWIYSLAGFLLAVTIFALSTTPGRHIRGIALLLYVVAGFSFSSSDAVMLLVLALTFLVMSYPIRTRSILADWMAVLSEKMPEVSGSEVRESLAT